jgi:LPS-assembly protein
LLVCALGLTVPQILLPQFSRILNLPPAPEPSPPSELTPDKLDHIARPNAPALDRIIVTAVTQTSDNGVRHLIDHAVIELSDSIIKADKIDYNEDTGDIVAEGHVFYQSFVQNEQITADKVEYNIETQRGKYYNVKGYVKSRVDARPGMLTSNNPFYFEGKWADRIEDKYIVHDGLITGCRLPHPWWTLRGPKFDVIPANRAFAYKSWFRIKTFPVFYMPFFYKSLKRNPRQSGFLTPNIGHSSLRGFMVGFGYYWAINRSYDLTYRIQDFSAVGTTHNLDFRGKPNERTDFNAIFYGVYDTQKIHGQTYSGDDATVVGKSDLGNGWMARGSINYLSSLAFRQEFSETFSEAIFSESTSSGALSKEFNSYTFQVIAQRTQLFEDATPKNYVILHKLPEIDFTSRDKQIADTVLPLWFSFDTSAALLHRSDPAENVVAADGSVVGTENPYSNQSFMPRFDVAPRIMTELQWQGLSIVPSFTMHESYFGQSFANGALSGTGVTTQAIANEAINRRAEEANVDILFPSIEKVYNKKTFLGDKLKHVIETRANYKYVTGVNDFNRLIRFDTTEILADTSQAEFTVTNRIYAKKGDTVNEVFTWELSQERYFDPTFGGAIVPGERNVTLDSLEFTAYAFLDRPRNYSPIDSWVHISPRPGLSFDWRADYDPLRGGLIDSGFAADVHYKHYNFSAGDNDVRAVYLYNASGTAQSDNQSYLSPPSNLFHFYGGFGDTNRRGWNAGLTGDYDLRVHLLRDAIGQVTYNTDCCGFTVQVRLYDYDIVTDTGTTVRKDTQYRIAFTIANVGQFGNMRKQERLF